MKRRSSQGFTLIEMLTVIVIILIIAGWVVSAYGPGSTKAARSRALAEIHTLSTANEAYKADNGGYVRGIKTEQSAEGQAPPIDPRTDGNPTSANYINASQFLYQELSGDLNNNGHPGDENEPTKGYMEFPPTMLKLVKGADGKVTNVSYIQDPFGNCYGYSTAGAKAEELFKAQVLLKGAGAERPDMPYGYNSTFDLWSTSGKILGAGTKVSDADRNRWVKNW